MGQSGNPAKRAEAPKLVPVEDDNAAEDFDAFWRDREASGQRIRKTTTIMGETVTLPASVPIWFELEAKRLRKSQSAKDIRKLVGILFGPELLDKWAAKGMDAEQFAVLLAWAPQVIAGMDVTLGQVAAELARLEDEPDPS